MPMTPDNTILAELQGISPYLAGVPRLAPYAAPVGYFAELPDLLLQRVKLSDDPKQELLGISLILASLSKKSPFSAPAGYFEQVPEEVNAGISAIEQTKEVLESLHPLLESVRYVNPYSAPENYFEELPALLLEKRPQQAKILGFGKSWFNYAAAAAVIGLVAIAGWLYQPQPVESDNNSGLVIQLEQEINQLSDEAIFEYADSTQQLFNGSTANNDDDLNTIDMHILLEEVSDGALQQYLSDQPGKANFINN
ncbi:hypothetical protein [Flavihumibacter fluvii]|uniref:hypothetical protein n=1 Tax=Flavihumibacter fluvii TaxID=2838157 RepID=UPI001BDE347F|nr:hypothetical protein [Flavihumibacter fluvii]ULQ52492.1 hypothetical protein KJS93_20600 [Flavihumibacter fluvii]